MTSTLSSSTQHSLNIILSQQKRGLSCNNSLTKTVVSDVSISSIKRDPGIGRNRRQSNPGQSGFKNTAQPATYRTLRAGVLSTAALLQQKKSESSASRWARSWTKQSPVDRHSRRVPTN